MFIGVNWQRASARICETVSTNANNLHKIIASLSAFRQVCNDKYATDSLTPWSRIRLEKLPGAQLLKNFPTLYVTRRFVTVFTRALPTRPYPEPDQSNPYHPILSKIHLNIVPPVSGSTWWSLLAYKYFFLYSGGVESKVHSALRLLNGVLYQPRVIMMMEKWVE
jgi:hypothetical protein